MENVVESAARHQQLLSDFDDLNQLGGIRIQVHHVSRFFRGLRAGIHGDAYVGLGQGGSVVGAVSGHGYQFSVRLFAPDQVHFFFGSGLGKKVIDPGFAGNRGGGERIVARDHDGANAHGTQLAEAFLDAAFHDVLELDHTERVLVLRDHQRRTAGARDLLDRRLHLFRETIAVYRGNVFCDRVRRAFADLAAVEVDA